MEHRAQLPVIQHGLAGTYNNHRCRCDLCSAAKAAYDAQYRATDAHRAAMIVCQARYNATDAGRAANAAAVVRYHATDAFRAVAVATEARRRVRKAGVTLVIRSVSTDCALCLSPLTDARWPDPMATTIGHEPPLSRLAELGHPPVYERPEHWGCNIRKGAKTDQELQQRNQLAAGFRLQ